MTKKTTASKELTTESNEAIIEFLKDKVGFKVEGGGFTDPNRRRVTMFLGDEEIAGFSFDVVQQREYEG